MVGALLGLLKRQNHCIHAPPYPKHLQLSVFFFELVSSDLEVLLKALAFHFHVTV